MLADQKTLAPAVKTDKQRGAAVMGKAITAEKYLARLQEIKGMLTKPEQLQAYPALYRLLTHGARNRRREYLCNLIDHIIKQKDHLRPVRDQAGMPVAYKLSITTTYIARELWALGRNKAISHLALFSGVLLICRRESDNVQAMKMASGAIQQKVEKEIIPEGFIQAPYDIWFDAWKPAQMNVKERKAQEWYNAGAPARITKERAIVIWGQSSANSMYSDGRKRAEETILAENRLIAAYRKISQRTGTPVVSKSQVLKELRHTVTAKEAEESWKRGRAALLKSERLRYKPISQAERELYGLPASYAGWMLLPNVNYKDTGIIDKAPLDQEQIHIRESAYQPELEPF